MSDMRHWMRLCEAAPAPVRKKSRLPPPTTPAFKSWFGRSKVVDRRGRPLVCYHGTFNTFDTFDPERGGIGLSFFSTNPSMANGYAASIRDQEGNLGAGAQVVPVYLRIIHPYDYRTATNQQIAYQFYQSYGYPTGHEARQIRIALYGRPDLEDDENPAITDDALEIDDFITALDQGAYPALELAEFLDFLQSNGYDGIITHEVQAINFGVFEPSQVKSVFAREFNPDSDHLSEDQDEGEVLQPSSIVRSLAPAICAEAQRLYDEWEQDAEGIDEIYGAGGICEQIAEQAIGSVLAGAGVNVVSGGDDEHANIVAQFSDGVFAVDIPPSIYERGGGYRWRKVLNVKFEPSHVAVDRLETDPAKFDQYSYE